MIAKTSTCAALALAAALAQGATARADEWDVATVNDGSTTTKNVLRHGSEQVHDLGAQNTFSDEDWYRVSSRRFSSYQMVVDGMTGQLQLTEPDLQLLDTLGTTVQASAALADFGGILSLAWKNATASTVPQFVRVRGAACSVVCLDVARYRIHFYDTTYTIARFNNSGTQATVLMVQNVTDRSCDATYVFQSSTGGLLGSVDRTLPARGLDVFATAPLVPSQSGSVRVAHTCGYGGLSGKAVSIEPAAGLAFDTEMMHRPH
jgi:hypothetical protein